MSKKILDYLGDVVLIFLLIVCGAESGFLVGWLTGYGFKPYNGTKTYYGYNKCKSLENRIRMLERDYEYNKYK